MVLKQQIIVIQAKSFVIKDFKFGEFFKIYLNSFLQPLSRLAIVNRTSSSPMNRLPQKSRTVYVQTNEAYSSKKCFYLHPQKRSFKLAMVEIFICRSEQLCNSKISVANNIYFPIPIVFDSAISNRRPTGMRLRGNTDSNTEAHHVAVNIFLDKSPDIISNNLCSDEEYFYACGPKACKIYLFTALFVLTKNGQGGINSVSN